MDIIIDAYNLLRLELADEHISRAQRTQFINRVRTYGQRKSHTMIIVFDGGEYRWPVQETHKGITIIYAGTHHSADEVIIQYIKRHLGRSMLLVSSDRQLRDEAAHYGVELLHARDFYDRFYASYGTSTDATGPVQVTKTADTMDTQLDELMQRVVRMQIKPDDEEPQEDDRVAKGHRMSRKERKRLQKLKKL